MDTLIGLTYPFWDKGKNQINCVPAMRDGNGNYQKTFPIFRMGTGITKKLSRYLGRERETQKSLPAVQEREFKAFPLGNIRDRKFPLMPTLYTYSLYTLSLYRFSLCTLNLCTFSLGLVSRFGVYKLKLYTYILYTCSLYESFHQLGPTGPSWSMSCHVRVCVCVYLFAPSSAVFF